MIPLNYEQLLHICSAAGQALKCEVKIQDVPMFGQCITIDKNGDRVSTTEVHHFIRSAIFGKIQKDCGQDA